MAKNEQLSGDSWKMLPRPTVTLAGSAKGKGMSNHYKWLDENFPAFTVSLGLTDDLRGLITAHGDKCDGYRNRFAQCGIPFEHGVAIYLISYVSPYSREVRETSTGWVDPLNWIINNYNRFASHLPPANTVTGVFCTDK